MIDPRHARSLSRALAWALAAPVACAGAGCCFVPFEDVVSGYASSDVRPMPAAVAARRPLKGSALPETTCKEICGAADECHAAELVNERAHSASLVVVCRTYTETHCSSSNFMSMPSGRARLGPRRAAPAGRPGRVAPFTALAALETESVAAFEELAALLSRHGAPPRLVRRAQRARRDEILHARLMRALAGEAAKTPDDAPTRPPAQRRRAAPTPTLLALALHNAREGCVGESWGALVAATWALRTSAPDVAAVMRVVARDETRHAAFSFALDAWLAGRLSGPARARVEAEKRRAARALLRRVGAAGAAESQGFRDRAEGEARARALFGDGLGLLSRSPRRVRS